MVKNPDITFFDVHSDVAGITSLAYVMRWNTMATVSSPPSHLIFLFMEGKMKVSANYFAVTPLPFNHGSRVVMVVSSLP